MTDRERSILMSYVARYIGQKSKTPLTLGELEQQIVAFATHMITEATWVLQAALQKKEK